MYKYYFKLNQDNLKLFKLANNPVALIRITKEDTLKWGTGVLAQTCGCELVRNYNRLLISELF